MLADRLRTDAIPCILTMEPFDSPAGRLIKSLKIRPEAHEEARLFTEDRRLHVKDVIAPAIKSGKVVVCDRYIYSSMAYQGARGIDPEKILSENREFAPIPDLIFLLEIPVEDSLSRIDTGRSSFSAFEDRAYLEKVKLIYQSLADPAIHRLDARGTRDQVHHQIISIVKSKL